MTGKVLWRRRFPQHGYELRREEVDLEGCAPVVMTSAYTLPGGHYIGGPKDARFLCVKRGIRPELRTATSSVCSIGKSTRDGRWYGWSHRALLGFKTKRAAMRFAESVS